MLSCDFLHQALLERFESHFGTKDIWKILYIIYFRTSHVVWYVTQRINLFWKALCGSDSQKQKYLPSLAQLQTITFWGRGSAVFTCLLLFMISYSWLMRCCSVYANSVGA